jgi:hypothetical protein
VVGGGNSAGQAAVFLSQTALKVFMLVRGADLAESMSLYLIQRISGNPSIELLCNSELCGLQGETELEEVSWINKQTGQVRSVSTHHLFIMVVVPRPIPTGCTAVSLLMRRALSSPDATYHWRSIQIEILLGRFPAHLTCSKAACQECSQLGMSGREASKEWLRRLAKDLLR